MPILRVNDLEPRVQYVADGAQTSFTVPFFFFEAADLEVRFNDGAEAAAHSVDGAGEAGGGAVLFDDPPPVGTRITIWREMALDRGTEFQEAGAFRAATINDELDRLAMLAQELSSRLDRAPAFPASSTAAPVALGEPAAGKYLRWSADGLALESVQPLDASAVAVSAFAETLLDDPDPAAARATLGLPAVLQNGAHSYGEAAGAANALTLAVTPAPAAYVAGQRFWFKAAANNTGPATLTVNGLAAKAIQWQGAPLVAGDIRAGAIVEAVYDGAAFQMTSPPPTGWRLLQSLAAANSPTLDFLGLDATYDVYKLVIADFRPGSDTDDLWLRLRDATLAAFQLDAGDYEYHTQITGADVSTVTAVNSEGDSKIRLTVNTGNASSRGISGEILFFNLAALGSSHRIRAQLAWLTSAAVLRGADAVAHYNGAQNPVDGIRLMFSSGHIASGRAALYGFRK